MGVLGEDELEGPVNIAALSRLCYKCTKTSVSFNYPHSLAESLPWSINLISFWIIIFLNGALAPDRGSCCAAELRWARLWLE